MQKHPNIIFRNHYLGYTTLTYDKLLGEVASKINEEYVSFECVVDQSSRFPKDDCKEHSSFVFVNRNPEGFNSKAELFDPPGIHWYMRHKPKSQRYGSDSCKWISFTDMFCTKVVDEELLFQLNRAKELYINSLNMFYSEHDGQAILYDVSLW